MSEYEFQALHLKIQIKYRNHLPIYYSVSLTPPTNYILTLFNPFSFVWYVIPLLKTGAFNSTCNLFQCVDNEKHKKNWRSHVPFVLLATILAHWRCPVASIEALTSSIRQYAWYCTGALPQPSKWPAKLVHFFFAVLFAVALAATGAIRSK